MTLEVALLSISCSVIASFVFLFLVLFVFKPKIRISSKICRGRFGPNDPKEYYFIKFINISLFSAYDIRVELAEVDAYPANGTQMNNRFIKIPLVVDTLSHVPGYRPSWWRKNAPYANRVRTEVDLSGILANEYKSVMVKIYLRHGLTGLVKVKTKRYVGSECVQPGRFQYGLKCDIVN